MAPTALVNIGRLLSGVQNAMIVNAPEKTPLAPSPAIALPTIKVTLFCATAHIKEPHSSIDIATMKAPVRLKV
jgi:hypothetical protein